MGLTPRQPHFLAAALIVDIEAVLPTIDVKKLQATDQLHACCLSHYRRWKPASRPSDSKMSKPVGLSTSIVAVIQITERIITLTKHGIEAVRDAPRDLHLIRIEVSTLKAVFESLLLQDSEAAETDGALSTAVEGCKGSVLQLEELVGPKQTAGDGTRQKLQETMSKFAWTGKKVKAKKILDDIAQYKQTIMLCLSAQSAYVASTESNTGFIRRR